MVFLCEAQFCLFRENKRAKGGWILRPPLTYAGVGQWGWDGGNLPLVSAIKISACPQ